MDGRINLRRKEETKEGVKIGQWKENGGDDDDDNDNDQVDDDYLTRAI